MKQILLRALAITACVAFSFAGAQAQVITAERAQEIANNFFQNGKQKSAAVRSTAAVSMKKSADSRILSSESSSDAPTFHILTPASGEGFVIVAGEEMENPIIGYSFDSKLPTDDELPENFIGYLADIDAQVKALRKYNAENPQKAAAARSAMQKTNYAATTMGDIVVQIETAKWGQREPFNNLCPEVDNSAVATGCVPTAYAIIAHYHKWPVSAKETTVTNAVTEDKITLGHEYDWTNMLSSYSGTYTETQATAVATLMRDLGYAYEVVYSSGNTQSGSGGETPTKFMDIFNYSCNTPNNHGNYATVRETLGNDVLWVQYIKASLDQSLPIPYSSTGDGGRHIFILDGYTDADYFHFNWGWNGQGNGWFTLNAMTPDTESDYSSSHRAYFNLTPNKTKYTVNASVSPENAGTVSINGGAATGEYLEGATVTLAATANTDYTFSHWSKGTETISTSKSCQVKVASSDNDYVANFLTVGNTTVDVTVSYNSSYGTVSGTNGTVANNTTLTPLQNEEVTLTATPLDGYVFNGWTVTKGTESTNYSGTSLTFVATGEMSVQANFTLAETDYIIDNTTGTELTTSRVTNWTHKEVDLTLSSDVDAIAYNGNICLFSGTGGVTYTLTAPTGYTITKYTFSQCKSPSDQYNISIIADSEYALTTSGVDITIDNVNTSSTQFIVRGSNGGDNRSAYTTKIIVTLKKEDAGSGSTPPATTTYTITATADPATAGSVTGGGTYNEGETVTLTATANSGYEFVNWTNNINADVVTENPYTVTATADVTYTANFQEAATTTYTITATADPATAGTVTGGGTYDEGATVTLTATANSGYTFKNWTSGTTIVSTNATYSFTANATAYTDLVANFEEETQTATEYPTPTGNTYTNNYLTSITTTGGDTNIDYSADAHPGEKLVVVPGKVQLAKGESFTMNLVAYSLGAGSSSVTREDMRYCHASLFTDFDQDFTFEASPVQTWGVKGPSGTNPYAGGNSNVYGNYDLVMNITHTITVPDDAPIGESRIRMIYTNAWKDWPTNGTAELDKGIVYDIVVEVVEKVDITANANEGGSVTINGEATSTKRVIKGSEVTVNATNAEGYKFQSWSDANGVVSETAEYTFTANSATTLTANFEEEAAAAVDLSGKYYRIKGGTNYWNIYDTGTHSTGPKGGVNMTAKAQNSDTQIFQFTKSGDGYKLKSLSGRYIRCYQWNVDADTDVEADGTVLVFETTGNELEYKIMWNNTNDNDYFMYGTANGENDGVLYPYCNAASTAATTWVLEEVTLHDVAVTANPADAGTATITVPTGKNDKVEHGTSVTLGATPNDGYNFTGWYNGETLISSDNPYTFTATANASYEARFEQDNSIDVLLTDEQGNNYRDRIQCDKNVNAVKTALLAKYPFIELDNNGVIEGNTFKCTVTLPFKVSNSDNTYWHNIYWPTGTNNNPVYMSALNGTDQYVSKVTEDAEYGSSSYNTYNNNSKISWAIYSVNESLEFKFKNELTGQFIKVTSVADGNAQNTEFVADEAEATVFTLLKDTGSYNGDYALTANVDDVTGYLCSTSALEYDYTTFYQGNSHEGAWVKFEEVDYISKIMDISLAINLKFGAGDGKYIINDDIQAIITALEDADNIKLNDLIAHGITIEDALKNWPKLQLAISPNNSGTTSINGEDGITSKYAPVGHEMTVTATALPGYIFANWANGTEEASSNTAHTFTLQGATNLTANFDVDNTRLTIATNVETIGGGEGGTVTGAGDYAPGSTVTLSATPSGTNYRFMGWYNENGEQVSTAATYEFTATTNVNYTAKFIKQVFVKIIQPKTTNETGIVYGYGYAATWIGNNITLTSTTVDYGTEVKIEVAVYDEFNSDVEFAYWSIDDVKISQENPYTFTATEDRYEFLANFNLKATLVVEAGDNGSAYIGTEGITSKEVVTGNTYTISAKANSGYAFECWVKVAEDTDTVSYSAVYTFKLTAELNETVKYKAYFKKITELEDGKAYRIKARMSDGSYRYIYRDGENIKWKDAADDTNNSIFIAQYDFTANDGSLNLISAVGDLGWNYNGGMSEKYVALKTVAGTVEGTFTLYGISGTEYRSYTAFSGTATNTTGDNINYYTSKDGSIQKVVDENVNGTTDFIFEEVPFEFNVGIANGSNAKLGTINLPFATTVHPSITAYAVTGSDENYAYVAPLTLENNILPAKTPVLVEAEEAGTYGFAPAPASNEKYETGFAGTLGAKEIADEVNAYILSYKGAGTAIKLYKLAIDDRTINANKAYYIDEAGNSSAISFKFVGTTDIDSVNSENENEKAIYDLQGRKLSEITEPGIYIVDGKKIMVK